MPRLPGPHIPPAPSTSGRSACSAPSTSPRCSLHAGSSSSSSSSSRRTAHSSRLVPRALASGGGGSDRPGSSGSGGGSNGGPARRSKPDRKARQPGLFEVKVVAPPPRSLGIYSLPPITHNGDQIEIDGQGYIVTRLELRFKLVKGRYVRDHSRLEVQPTGRYFVNLMLNNCFHGTYIGETGQQD